MTEEKVIEVVDLPSSFAPRIVDGAFAAMVFVSPRSKRWPYVRNLCQEATCIEEDKNLLAIFDYSPGSIRTLANVLHESYAWKTAYLFIYGKTVDKSHTAQWLRCYLQSFDHEDPRRTYCLKENYYYHFQNQLSKTAKNSQTVSFITPCICAAAFARFSDQLPSSFKEQFDSYAKIRFANLCPNYNFENFKGPFIRNGSPYDLSIRINIDSENTKPKARKTRIGCLPSVAIIAISLFIFGKVAGC